MTLMKHVRIIQQEARAAARLVNVHVDVVGAGKHLALEFSSATGKRRRLPVASSPGNTDTAIINTRKQVQRILGELS